MPGRSPHRRSPPPPPMISRRSPVLRGRMRSPPDRRRPPAAVSPRLRRPADFRPTSVRRSRSPIGKVRSLSPPIKRNLSPKRIRESSRRVPPQPTRKLSRSKSPIGPPHLPAYKAGPSTSGSAERFRSGSYERERVQFRGPEGSINFDINELKKIAVEIRRTRGPVDESTRINRSITSPEEIVPIRRPGMRGRDMPSGFPDNGSSKPDWVQDGSFRRHKEFQNDGPRPVSLRPEFVAESSRDRQSDEYRRIVAIDSVQNSDRDKERSRDVARFSPPRYEERSRPYYSGESRERPRSPGYPTSRRSPPRSEFFEVREKILDDRRGSSRDDLRHELDLRRRDDGRYPERHGSYERESDLRTRIIEKRIEPHSRHEERLYERERRPRDHLSPPIRERRRGSIEAIRPSRGEAWEREHERETGGERRKRPLSRDREREDGRMRGNGRERFEEFDDVVERPRRFPFKPEHRGYFKDEGEFASSAPIRGRGRGIPTSAFRGRPMSRGAPRGFRGGPFIRGGPPRGAFRSRGGFIPRK